MRSLLLLAVAALGLAAADFKTGLDAYNRGDFATALKEWQPIAEKGDPHAQYNLGLLYARGQGVTQDYAKAVEWYRKAAGQGVPAAQYNLGLMYANGQGVAANPEEASKWFLKAAEHGITDAATGLANVFHAGEGAFQNPAEAEKWYRAAAEKGVASAAFNLGIMYDLGQGVSRNYEEAFKWYMKAAEGGYPGAMVNLGILYYNAQGVKRDLVEAYAWFARAQKAGDRRAPQLVATTGKRMQPDDLKKAQDLADRWTTPAKPAGQPVDVALFKPKPGQPAAAASSEADRAAPATARTPAAIQSVWPEVARVIAVGDVHGDYEQFAAVLQSAGLIDGNGAWTGGKAHLVQTGDILDRGPDSRAVMDLLIRLEKEAAAAGGAVHALIGNHEAMNAYGDLRYVSPGEFSAFARDGDDAARPASIDRSALTETARPSGAARFPLEQPPGYTEHRAAFGPAGEYGRWIRSHNAAIKIGRTLFLHAGLGPRYAAWTLDRINSQVRDELNDFTRLHGGIVTDEEGPLWYRGLASGDQAKLATHVDDLLRRFDVDRIVIGHSYAQAAITPRFGGKVVLIDIGLSRVYDNIGKMGALAIESGKPFALHRGQKVELPKDADGPDMLRYLKEAAVLDPKPSPLDPRVAELQKKQNQQ